MPYYPQGGTTYYLGSSIGSTDTTILLSSFLEPVTGEPITMALMNTDIAYGTIGPKTTSSEFISFTGIVQNSNGTATLTGVTRGLSKHYPFTADTDFRLPHAGQSVFILSDAPQVFNQYSVIQNDETITGKKTFPAGGNADAPVSGTVYSAPTDDLEYASKKYVDDVAIAGAPDATTGVKGIVQLPTQAQVDAKTATGSTGASLTPTPANLRATKYNDYVADTGSANAYAIAPSPVITAYTAGQVFIFKATNANTTASTLNVNSLGTISIVKGYNTPLIANDILANQIVEVCCDGTNMVMLSRTGNAPVVVVGDQTIAGVKTFSSSPVAPTPSGATDVAIKSYVDGNPITSTNGTTTYDLTTASGTQNIAHGLGRTPKRVRISAVLYTGSIAGAGTYSQSFGVYNGTTNSCIYTFLGATTSLDGTDNTNGVHITLNNGDSSKQSAVITVDGTNIILTWTRTSTPSGTARILWEAQ